MKTSLPLAILLVLLVSDAVAALEPSKIREALPKKTETYLSEGIVMGGDREVRASIVKDLRRATNAGYERVVLDLEANGTPFYQASIEPSAKRIVVTVFGNPRLGLDARRAIESFRKSPLVESIELFPKLEDDAWTFALHLRAAVPAEVFELSSPTRIIIDLKGGQKALGSATESVAAAPVHRPAAAKKKPAPSVKVKRPPHRAIEKPAVVEDDASEAPLSGEIPE
jgi:hypothetical protein